MSAAMLTLSGRVDEKERRTLVEWISVWPFMGSLLTAMTFWLESAARISSSLSTTGTSKITPLHGGGRKGEGASKVSVC